MHAKTTVVPGPHGRHGIAAVDGHGAVDERRSREQRDAGVIERLVLAGGDLDDPDQSAAREGSGKLGVELGGE